MDIGIIGLLSAVSVFMVLIVVVLNKRIDDLRADLKGDTKTLQDGQSDLKGDIKALQAGQIQLIASVAWLMAKAGATPDELATLYQDPPSTDD